MKLPGKHLTPSQHDEVTEVYTVLLHGFQHACMHAHTHTHTQAVPHQLSLEPNGQFSSNKI